VELKRARSWLYVLGLTVTCVAACTKQLPAEYDEAKVKEIVRPGAARGVIVSSFGKPVYEASTEDGGVVLIYRMRPRHSTEKNAFGGFEVYLRNDKVVGWDRITSDTRTYDRKETPPR